MTRKTGSGAGIGGPKTAAGRRRSSLNALKHGLYAESPQARQLVLEEVGVDFDAILRRMRAHYIPADPLEDELVNRIARCTWRLAMSSAMEERLIQRNQGLPYSPGLSYERIMRYERLVDVHLHRAIAALARKRQAAAQLNP